MCKITYVSKNKFFFLKEKIVNIVNVLNHNFGIIKKLKDAR